MSFQEVISSGGPVLADGGIETWIMFETDRQMDPELGSVSLLEDRKSADVLASLYADYLGVAIGAELPVVLGTPTFRASALPVAAAGRGGAEAVRQLNTTAVRFLAELRADSEYQPVWLAGVIGPAGDAYTPAVALSADDARAYHGAQAETLAEAGVDFLFAPTFPAVSEAIGVCQAMGETGLPAVVSFVLDRDGNVLDGTPLAQAIDQVDQVAAPTYHSISCVHPAVAERALRAVARTGGAGRIREVKANASALTPAELVQLDHLEGDKPKDWAADMARLHRDYGVTVVGGCCGTDQRHLRALAEDLVLG